MAKDQLDMLTFNRGVVSALALGRTDIKRVAMSAQEQTNFIPRVLGPMSLRPGFEYIGSSKGNQQAFYIPFIFSTSDTAIIELTNNAMRVRVDEDLVTRPAVSATTQDPTFITDTNVWVDNDEIGGASSYETYLDGSRALALFSDGSGAAIRDQAVSVTAGVVHALNIKILAGACTLRVGSTSGGQEYISETVLRKGVHSLAFTPSTTTAHIRFLNRRTYPAKVTSCQFASAGEMKLETLWPEVRLRDIRVRQSGDVIFVACRNIRQQRIERRGAQSWSVVDYVADLGPFLVDNSTPITLQPGALSGEVALTASAPVFRDGHVGALFAVNSTGQAVSRALSAANVFSDPIRITGVGSGRNFAISITGTWSATVTLQRSVGAVGAWVDVTNYTANTSTTLTDGLDNQIIFYRIGIKAGNYTSGTPTGSLSFAAGSIKGIGRVFQIDSPTQASVAVVKDFGALTPSTQWAEGAWSDRRGYPSSVELYEGRVWWAGADKIYGSVSDDFANFDDSVTGDSGAINRSIGTGPVDTINWLVASQQLLVGAQGSELVCRSSSLGEPLTPTNFNLKPATSRGSLGVDAVVVDTSVVFVDRSGSRAYELEYDSVGSTFAPKDMTAIVPEICSPGIYRIGVQRREDTRLHFIRADGKVALLVFDKTEDVRAWVIIETDGEVEDVFVLPGTEEDKVYYSVKRTINGNTVRYLERWALQSECEGGVLNKQADSFITYTGTATTTITGLSHLEGKSVVVWADGQDRGTFTVASGQITLPTAVSNAVVGLPYTARFRSVKMKYLTKHKILQKLGLVLKDTHAQGLRFGQDFDHMDGMPLVEEGKVVDSNYVWEDYEFDNLPVDGTFEQNSRLCLEAAAPRPCTILAATVTVEVNEK